MTEALLVWVLVFAVAGWLSGWIIQGAGSGVLDNTVIGFVAGVLTWYALPLTALQPGTGFIAAMVTTTIAACLIRLAWRILIMAGRP